MPGISPQSHEASGWGSAKVGTSSRWYLEPAPHLSQFLISTPFTPYPTDNRPTHPRMGVTKYTQLGGPTGMLAEP